MDEPRITVAAIRAVLFRNALALHEQLVGRFLDVGDHLNRREDRAVIGALEGAEADIAKMRSLMVLLRDCFPVRPEGGDKH